MKNLVFILLTLTTLGLTSCNQKKTPPPNIIFFIADDMYQEMFNCLPEGKGKNLTPNIDRLAREGTIMMNQYVVSPVCTPSRYNCLTGNYASRSTAKQFLEQTKKEEGQTVIHWNSFITANDKILPHYLQELGYTSGMVGKNHVVEVQGLYQFPDYYADPQDAQIKKRLEDNYNKVEQAILHSGFDYAGGIYHNNPNFIGLAKLAVQNMDWIAEAGLEGNNKELVLSLDDALGALINKLEEHKILDNSIIFFFNDHGQVAKGSLYQGGALNPSIIWKSGGFEVGNICETKITNIDFAPTILEFAGAENMDEHFDGNSFKAALEGQEANSNESLFFELGYSRAVIKGNFKYLAIRYPEYANNMTPEERKATLEAYNKRREFRNMVIVNRDPAKAFSHFSAIPGGQQAEFESYGKKPAYFDSDQLYNLEADPDELFNLANDPKHQALLADMKRELQKYLQTLPGRFGEFKR